MSAAPLRVLHILGELRPSGAETMLAVAAPIFAEGGVAADVLSTGKERGAFADRLKQTGYGVHHVPFSKTPGFFWRLWRLMRTGYDVIHIHTEQANFWVGLTALCAGVPVVLKSIHSTFAFTGGLRLRRKLQRHVLAWLGVRQISVGASVRDVERRHFGLDTEVIRNWFDVARFREPSEAERREARTALGCRDGEVVLVSVGNCHPIKNHGELLRAIALLPPDGKLLYVHVGEEEQGRPERELASALGVADRVRFLGSLPDVRVALHAADCFVMTSLREGMSISTLEAMASGLPAILTDVDGLRDFRTSFAGLTYAEPTAKSLAAALRSFLGQDAASRRRAARHHASIAHREYDARAGAEAYLRVYRGS
jgi:glycosyltransferase involved in cell wall biosynthesis